VDKPISNFSIRLMLETLREIRPAGVDELLSEAGLAWLKGADLGDASPALVKTSQLAKVYAVVHQHLGETLTRLFLTNYGNKMAPMLLEHPTVKSLAQKSKTLPAAGRAGWAIKETCAFLNTIWANVQMREDPGAWYLEVDQCPICAGIQGASAPICASSEIIYTTLLRAIGGQWPTFKEVACRAQGSPLCSYRLAK